MLPGGTKIWLRSAYILNSGLGQQCAKMGPLTAANVGGGAVSVQAGGVVEKGQEDVPKPFKVVKLVPYVP